jgi:predicted nucleic acid-binding protein
VKAALDTNILAYAEGVNGVHRRQAALQLIGRLPTPAVLIPVQALGELYNVLTRKAGRSAADARARIVAWSTSFATADTTRSAVSSAADLAAVHQLGIWDSIIIAVAVENGCELLLSEDLQDGFIWSGLTIVNPFAEPRTPLLEALLESSTGEGPVH